MILEWFVFSLFSVNFAYELERSAIRHCINFTRATITKYPKLGGLNNKSVFCHNSGGWKLKTSVLTELIS